MAIHIRVCLVRRRKTHSSSSISAFQFRTHLSLPTFPKKNKKEREKKKKGLNYFPFPSSENTSIYSPSIHPSVPENPTYHIDQYYGNQYFFFYSSQRESMERVRYVCKCMYVYIYVYMQRSRSHSLFHSNFPSRKGGKKERKRDPSTTLHVCICAVGLYVSLLYSILSPFHEKERERGK